MTIDDPGERDSGRLAVGVIGPALFLTARIRLAALVDGSRPWARLVGVPAIIVGGLASVRFSQLVSSAVVAGVLLLIVLLDAMPGLWRFIGESAESDQPDQRRSG